MGKRKEPGPARRDETLNLRVPHGVKDALRRAAKEDGRTVSNMAVRLLQEQLVARGFLGKG